MRGKTACLVISEAETPHATLATSEVYLMYLQQHCNQVEHTNTFKIAVLHHASNFITPVVLLHQCVKYF